MSQTIRLLPFAGADGATNMALDEALLESAAAGGVASLRFYAWADPTLSLGYFQPAAERLADANLARLPFVRRATGGGAIVHHHEHWICRMHHVVQRVLAGEGVVTHAVACGEERKLGAVVCFLNQTRGDLVLNGSKVAGSAQRKLRGALLQHGSILLRRSEFAPALAGVSDAAGAPELKPEPLADLIVTALAADTGWAVVPGAWTAEERARAAAVRAEKYAHPDWNGKR